MVRTSDICKAAASLLPVAGQAFAQGKGSRKTRTRARWAGGHCSSDKRASGGDDPMPLDASIVGVTGIQSM
jgi:hypothetical protein